MGLGDGKATGFEDLAIADLLHEVMARVPGLDDTLAKLGFLVPAGFLVPGDAVEARLAGTPLPALGKGAVQLVTSIDARKPGLVSTVLAIGGSPLSSSDGWFCIDGSVPPGAGGRCGARPSPPDPMDAHRKASAVRAWPDLAAAGQVLRIQRL